jgi:hypothetical protein
MEVEKSALALTAWVERIGRRILPVAIGGCWGWRGRIGKVENSNGLRVDEVGPIPDLRHCAGREIYVLLDATRSAIQKCSRRGRRSFGNWSTGAAESSAVALNFPALAIKSSRVALPLLLSGLEPHKHRGQAMQCSTDSGSRHLQQNIPESLWGICKSNPNNIQIAYKNRRPLRSTRVSHCPERPEDRSGPIKRFHLKLHFSLLI